MRLHFAPSPTADDPELDLAVPAIDRGARLPRYAGLPPIAGCRGRASAFAAALAGREN